MLDSQQTRGATNSLRSLLIDLDCAEAKAESKNRDSALPLNGPRLIPQSTPIQNRAGNGELLLLKLLSLISLHEPEVQNAAGDTLDLSPELPQGNQTCPSARSNLCAAA